MEKIVVLEKIEITPKQKNRLETPGNVEWYDSPPLEKCVEIVKNADVVVIDWIDPNPFLRYMKKGSLLALMSTTYGWIDVEKAKKLKISVSNIPDYATEAVAEHVFGLMLCLAKRIVVGDKDIRKGNRTKGYLRGFEIKGKTLGIIGLGKIGSRVAEIASSIGMNVIAYDIIKKNNPYVKFVSMEELLKKSDVVSINCLSTKESKNMLNKDALSLMKKFAILIGTVWDIVDINALTEVLKEKRIFGAGFDVAIEGSELELPEELVKLDNIVLTPHIAFNTYESKIRQVDTCISNIKNFLKGNPKNIVNC